MFEQIVIAGTGKRNTPFTFVASLTLQTAAVGIALAIPLLHVARMEPKLPDIIYFTPKRLGPAESVRKVVSQAVTSANSNNSQLSRSYKPFQWPSKIPTQIATGPDPVGAPVFPIGPPSMGSPDGVPGGSPVEIVSQRFVPIAQPEPVHHQPPPPVTQLRVATGVQAAKLTFGPKPVYPPLARAARISGTVHLSALIASDGRIRGLQVVNGHPMLSQAALDAVKQWVYQPTLLNGDPVEVLTEIDVNFVLSQ